MSRSKTATPVASDSHPAHQLTYVSEDLKTQLLKTPLALVLEQDTYKIQLKELRNDWRYAWVIQWLYYFRGAIKLSGEPFTVDLLEEELVGLTEPNLINKIPTALATTLLGTKVKIEDFSFRARFLLGDATDVLGTEEAPVDYQSLSLVDKFEVLHCLISQLQYTDIFRAQVDKYENPSELRFDPIYEDDVVSYYLLSDNRIYKRTITNVPKMEVPRKFKRAKLLNPEVDFADIEPEITWEVVAIGIYQIHEFLVSLKSNRKMKLLFDNIKTHIDELAQEDLNTRKKILKRKKEQKLHDLVSHRKRSSRLVEKEEQHKQEMLKRQEEEERLRKQQEKARAQRRYKQKLAQIKKDIEERLKRQTQSRRSALLEEYKPSNVDDIELGEGDWLFECYCGIREKNYDDGVKLIVCERCQRWQHLKCQDRAVRQELATKADEVLICQWCLDELEREVAQKIEDDKKRAEEEEIRREKERELQKELHRKKMEEERKRKEEEERRLEEAERLRKEELEKERQRRALERKGLAPKSGSSSPELINEAEFNRPTPPSFQQLPPQQPQHRPPPMMGTFQARLPPIIQPNGQHVAYHQQWQPMAPQMHPMHQQHMPQHMPQPIVPMPMPMHPQQMPPQHMISPPQQQQQQPPPPPQQQQQKQQQQQQQPGQSVFSVHEMIQ